jgi:hypothetical protein
MIDKLIYKFFAFWDGVISKIDDCFNMDFSHCEKHDCPKKKKKLNKNNKYFKS